MAKTIHTEFLSAPTSRRLNVMDHAAIGELPVEMISRKCSNAAEPLDRKIIVQVIVNVVEHLSESGAIALCDC